MRTIKICVALIAVGLITFISFQRHMGVSRAGVSSHTANLYLSPSLALPNAATDVTFYVDFGAAESEFAISEDAFLAWCQCRGWPTDPIVTPTAYFEPMWLPTDKRLVTLGYTYSPPDGQGVFDANRSRACYWISTFP